MKNLIPKECCEFGEFKCAVPTHIRGRRQEIDICIADIVAALNAANIETTASCCGHCKKDASIMLWDGRVLTIGKENIKVFKND